MTSLQEAFAFSEGKRGLCLVLEDYVTRIYYKCPKCISYFSYYILLIFKLKVEGCKPVSDIIIIRVVPPLTPHQ